MPSLVTVTFFFRISSSSFRLEARVMVRHSYLNSFVSKIRLIPKYHNRENDDVTFFGHNQSA